MVASAPCSITARMYAMCSAGSAARAPLMRLNGSTNFLLCLLAIALSYLVWLIVPGDGGLRPEAPHRNVYKFSAARQILEILNPSFRKFHRTAIIQQPCALLIR